MAKKVVSRRISDTSDKNDELRQLRQENKKLKRQLSQARKQIVRLLQQDVDLDDLEAPQINKKQRCLKCQEQDTKELLLGQKTYVVCLRCKHRWVL